MQDPGRRRVGLTAAERGLSARSGRACAQGWGLAASVEHVADGEDRVPPEHARPGVRHDHADLLAAMGLVAVDRTMDAGRFRLAVGTSLQPDPRVGLELSTLGAEVARTGMVSPAIGRDHRGDRLAFALEPRVFERRRGRQDRTSGSGFPGRSLSQMMLTTHHRFPSL